MNWFNRKNNQITELREEIWRVRNLVSQLQGDMVEMHKRLNDHDTKFERQRNSFEQAGESIRRAAW